MPDAYSVNQLKVWSTCQKRYELDQVRKLRWPSNPKNFRLGKGVHQLLDYGSRQLPLQQIIDATDKDIVLAWSMIDASRWAGFPVVASEWGFSLGIAGRWLYGRIDRIALDGQAVLILDWKTGTGVPLVPEEDWQTRVYLYAVYEARKDLRLDVPPEAIRFVYVQVKDQVVSDVSVSYNQDRHEETRQRLIQVFEAIETAKLKDQFQLPKRCPDRFCPYRSICGIESVSSGQTLSPNGEIPEHEVVPPFEPDTLLTVY